MSLSTSNASCVPEGLNRRAFNPLQECSKSDPVLLHCQLPQGDSFFSVSDCVMVLEKNTFQKFVTLNLVPEEISCFPIEHLHNSTLCFAKPSPPNSLVLLLFRFLFLETGSVSGSGYEGGVVEKEEREHKGFFSALTSKVLQVQLST